VDPGTLGTIRRDYENASRTAAALTKVGNALSYTWGGVKSVFGAAKTVVGVTVDTLGASVHNISRYGCGIYYGDKPEDRAADARAASQRIFTNYYDGTSGSDTIRTAGTYMEGAKEGAQKAGKWAGTALGDNKAGHAASWVLGHGARLTVGTFTDFSSGLYKTLDKRSTTSEVAAGFAQMGMSCVSVSKAILPASQMPGFAVSAGANAARTGSITMSWLRTSQQRGIIKSLTSQNTAIVTAAWGKGGMKGPAMLEVISNARSIVSTKEFMASLVAWRAEMAAAIKQSVKDGAWARLTNLQTVVKDELLGVIGKGMDGSAKGAIEAGLGGSAKELIDNLVSQAIDDQIQNVIDGMLAGAPDAEELNGTWNAVLTVQGLLGEQPPASGAAPDVSADQGCDLGINLAELIGKALPMKLKLTLSPDGIGTAQMVGEGGGAAGTAQYDRETGRLTVRMIKDKATMNLMGTAKRGPAPDPKIPGPPVLSGTFTIKQGEQGLRGAWTARQ
jgi:hypothetical protein